MDNWSTIITTKQSLLMEAKTQKAMQLPSKETRIELTKNGRFCILMKLARLELVDLTKNLDSKSINPSTLELDFQVKELLNVGVQTKHFYSLNGNQIINVNNGSLMRSPRQSRMCNGHISQCRSQSKEPITMCNAIVPTQDGGNFGNMMALVLEISRTESFLIPPEEKMESK